MLKTMVRIFHIRHCFSLCSKSTSSSYFSTLSTKTKLDEIPEVCTREDWSTIIQQCRQTLQKYPMKPVKHNTGFITTQNLIKRIESIPNRSSYLVRILKQLLADTRDNVCELRWPGLVTLMLSKSVGNPFQADDFVSRSLEDDVWSSQICLAEVINLLHCYFVFRKESTKLARTTKNVESEIDKLVYSYFTSLVFYKMSTLSNYKMAPMLGDILESSAQERLSNNNHSLFHNQKHWEHHAFHPQGLLLASGCQAALELAGLDERHQHMAFQFGRNFAFAMKAHGEIQQYWNYQHSHSSMFHITSFPVALHLQNNPETLMFIYRCNNPLDNINTDTLSRILQLHSAMEESKIQLQMYVRSTIKILQELQNGKNNDVTDNLVKLINTFNH